MGGKFSPADLLPCYPHPGHLFLGSQLSELLGRLQEGGARTSLRVEKQPGKTSFIQVERGGSLYHDYMTRKARSCCSIQALDFTGLNSSEKMQFLIELASFYTAKGLCKRKEVMRLGAAAQR